MPTALFYAQEGPSAIRCSLCPHRCLIQPGQAGICRVRVNSDGEMTLPYFGRASAIASDPIEKKPLYHFHPGSQILSVGFLGCNLRCPFCQNYRISQSTAPAATTIDPHELVERALSVGSIGIAYTYNEPIIHFEYVYNAALIARDAGLKNVLVTAGFLQREPAEELLPLIDAANVDLKSFSDEGYRRTIGGRLQPVKQFITAAAAQCHVEVTTLLVPGFNDSEAEITQIAEFLAEIDPAIPLHLSAYHPAYKFDRAATSADLLDARVAIARRHLHYVYPGNVAGESNTYCRRCGAPLVKRSAYRVRTQNLAGDACANCGASHPLAY